MGCSRRPLWKSWLLDWVYGKWGQLKVGSLRGVGIQYLDGRLFTGTLAVHMVVVWEWVAVVGWYLYPVSLLCQVTEDSIGEIRRLDRNVESV